MLFYFFFKFNSDDSDDSYKNEKSSDCTIYYIFAINNTFKLNAREIRHKFVNTIQIELAFTYYNACICNIPGLQVYYYICIIMYYIKINLTGGTVILGVHNYNITFQLNTH